MRRLLGPIHRFLEAIFPAPCPVCDGDLPWTAPAGVCPPCWSEVRPLQPPLCDRCGFPFPHFLESDPPHLCPRCRRHPPPFRRGLSLGHYDRHLREILHLFKFGGRSEIAAVLGPLMAAYARARAPGADWDAILAVPLHRARRRRRGFNPAGELARSVARRLGLPRLRRVLVRVRNTPPQAGLRRRQRLRNVRGAFRARRPDRLRDRSILLVDDVLTTGATASECAAALLAAGARRVDLLTAARSPYPEP